MAERQQGSDRGGMEPSVQKAAGKGAQQMRVPPVDFNEMNYEQRRAPYNSGSRIIGEKKFDEPSGPDHSAQSD